MFSLIEKPERLKESGFEFHKKGEIGELTINWYIGDLKKRQKIEEELLTFSFEGIKKLIIIGNITAESANSCFRMIHRIIAYARSFGINCKVVIPNKELLEASKIGGIITSAIEPNQVFLSKAQAGRRAWT